MERIHQSFLLLNKVNATGADDSREWSALYFQGGAVLGLTVLGAILPRSQAIATFFVGAEPVVEM